MASHQVVFLFDVDNTLLDNDRVSADLRNHLEQAIGHERQQRYWDNSHPDGQVAGFKSVYDGRQRRKMRSMPTLWRRCLSQLSRAGLCRGVKGGH